MKKILIVDDLAANRKLLKGMLGALATCSTHILLEAENGDQALTVYAKEKPDLVLLDINMPGMSGYDVASAMKSLAKNDYIPIIFVTALSAEQGLYTALQSGGDDYICKPFDIGVLESKIHAHLRIRELNREILENNERLKQQNSQLKREQELIEHFFENALAKSFLDERYIRYHMSSMSAFNGDVFLSHKGADGGLYLLVGDFTGHGLTAAMGTLPVAMIFFEMTRKGVSLKDIIVETNRQLHELMPTSMFLAATFVYLHPCGKKVSIWMGGMPETFLISGNNQLKQVLHSRNLPLGIIAQKEFSLKLEELEVELGDKLYFFSDGITEARNKYSNEMFSNRLSEVLLAVEGDRIKHVIREMKAFSGREEPNDDITMVELTCKALSPSMASDDKKTQKLS